MSNKFGVHEHGEKLTIDADDPNTRECLSRLVRLHDDATRYLQVLILQLGFKRKSTLPCKQCLRDTALQFKDVGSLLEELIGDKCLK